MRVCILVFALSAAVLAASSEQSAIGKYCVGCHNEKLRSGSLSLTGLSVEDPAAHAAEWERVARKLRGRYMPPAGFPRPNEQTYPSIVSKLESSLDHAASEHPNPGRPDTFRR